MRDPIFPRSPRETMCGWMHLPRYIDKIRLHLAGQLHPDYQDDFGKGFDHFWLRAAGLNHEEFVEVVKDSITDGQVAEWVRRNVHRTETEKHAHAEAMLSLPKPDDMAMQERFNQRKADSGFAGREDLLTFLDLIEADEGRA